MSKTPRILAVAGAALVVGLGLGVTALPALAAQDPILTEEQRETFQTQIDAYKACLQGQGVTLPERPADGTPPELTEEQRAAMRAAREACADQRPQRPQLSDEQRAELRAQVEEHRACMEEQLSAAGITRPERPDPGTQPSGERPPRPQLTDEQRAAIQSARAACEDLEPNLGVDVPGPFGHGHGPRGHRPFGPGAPSEPEPGARATSTAV